MHLKDNFFLRLIFLHVLLPIQYLRLNFRELFKISLKNLFRNIHIVVIQSIIIKFIKVNGCKKIHSSIADKNVGTFLLIWD